MNKCITICMMILFLVSCERLEVEHLQKEFKVATQDIRSILDELDELNQEIDTIKITVKQIDSVLVKNGITKELFTNE